MNTIKYTKQVRTNTYIESNIKDIYNLLKNNISSPLSLYEVYEKDIVKIHYDFDINVGLKDTIDKSKYIESIEQFNEKYFGDDCEGVYCYDDKTYKSVSKKDKKLKRKISIHYVVYNKKISIKLMAFIIKTLKEDNLTPEGLDAAVYRSGMNKFRFCMTNKEATMETRKSKTKYMKPVKTSFKYFERLCVSNALNDINEWTDKVWITKMEESYKKKINKTTIKNVKKLTYKLDNVSNTLKKNVIDLIIKGFNDNFLDDYEIIKPFMIIMSKEGYSVEEISNYINLNIINNSSKYINNVEQIENIIKNTIEKDYTNTFGTLIYWSKKFNSRYFEEEVEGELNELMDSQKFNEDKIELDSYINRFKRIKRNKNQELKLFNTYLYIYIKNKSFNDMIDNHNGEKVECIQSNYNLLKNYVSDFYISLRNSNRLLKKSKDLEKNKYYFCDTKRSNLNMSDLLFDNIKAIGTEEEVKEFLNPITKDKIKEVNGLFVCYNTKSLWDTLVKDIRFNRYINYNYKPIGLNEKYDRSIDIIFNTFEKFGYKEIEEKGYVVKEKHIETMKIFLEYIFKCVCSNNYDTFFFFLCWISEIIKNPRKKNGICIIFYSLCKKTGKGKLGKFIMSVIGNDNSLFSDIDLLFGRFDNNGETILNIYDELNRDSFNKKNYNKLKGLITEIDCEKEKKGVDIQRGYDYNKYILNTNELDFLKTDADETRFSILNFLKLWGTDFDRFNNVLKEVYNNEIYSLMFGKLLENINYDMTDRTDWDAKKPQNKIDSLVKNLNIIEEYLKDLYKGTNYNTYNMEYKDNKIIIGKMDFYENFKEYYLSKSVKEKHFDYRTFIRVFDSICMDYRTIEIRRRKEYIVLDIKGLYINLKNRSILDEDCNIENVKKCLNIEYEEEKKEEMKKNIKKEGYNIRKKDKNIKSEAELNIELFNKFINKHYEVKKVIKKKVIKKIIIKKVVKKVVEEITELEVFIDEDGQETILFNECLID